mmetsp:Transcript_10032/g.28951  ORF Transcript_10032/g.28951 Transcript_10032/m.28951 type:complete len:299 (-) Transcript_10032:407-1303(-)
MVSDALQHRLDEGGRLGASWASDGNSEREVGRVHLGGDVQVRDAVGLVHCLGGLLAPDDGAARHGPRDGVYGGPESVDAPLFVHGNSILKLHLLTSSGHGAVLVPVENEPHRAVGGLGGHGRVDGVGDGQKGLAAKSATQSTNPDVDLVVGDIESTSHTRMCVLRPLCAGPHCHRPVLVRHRIRRLWLHVEVQLAPALNHTSQHVQTTLFRPLCRQQVVELRDVALLGLHGDGCEGAGCPGLGECDDRRLDVVPGELDELDGLLCRCGRGAERQGGRLPEVLGPAADGHHHLHQRLPE